MSILSKSQETRALKHWKKKREGGKMLAKKEKYLGRGEMLAKKEKFGRASPRLLKGIF